MRGDAMIAAPNILYVDASDLGRLNRNLKAWIGVSGKSEDEALNKKGNDLRIRLFKGFWGQRWKRGGKGGGFRLLRQLVRAGKGILVRLMNLRSPWDSQIPATDKNGKPLNLRQKLVAQEIIRRQAGVGILGVSFLRKRWAYKKEAKYLTENRTRGFGKAVSFEKSNGAFTITGFTPGLAKVAAKYGILASAIRGANVDTEEYLLRKMGPEFLQTLHA
jgi:hypothetical protein